MKIGAAGNGGNPLLPERSALSPSPWHCFLRPKNDVQTIGYGNRRCRSFSILPYRPPPPHLSLSAIPSNLPASHAIKKGGATPLRPTPTIDQSGASNAAYCLSFSVSAIASSSLIWAFSSKERRVGKECVSP